MIPLRFPTVARYWNAIRQLQDAKRRLEDIEDDYVDAREQYKAAVDEHAAALNEGKALRVTSDEMEAVWKEHDEMDAAESSERNDHEADDLDGCPICEGGDGAVCTHHFA